LPDDANLRIALDVALHASGLPATLADYTTDVAPEALGRRLVIACFPKSASTFLKSVLMGVTGFPERNLAFAHGQNETGRFDVMVDDRAAWYLGFFAGWQRAIRSGRIDGHWLTYETLMADQAGALGEILRFHGLDRPREAIEAAIAQAGSDRTATHFNKGVVGRGRARFNDRQVAQIRRIAGHHPDVDFSPIGL
jgi:hypothetical protein